MNNKILNAIPSLELISSFLYDFLFMYYKLVICHKFIYNVLQRDLIKNEKYIR